MKFSAKITPPSQTPETLAATKADNFSFDKKADRYETVMLRQLCRQLYLDNYVDRYT